MKVKHLDNNEKKVTYEFTSIQEFVEYIQKTPRITSANVSERTSHEYIDFCGTKDMKEALDLLKNGWTEGAQKIEKGLKAKEPEKTTVTGFRQRSVYDVVGGNASVPRYLQGVPTNMIRQVRTPVKQKIVNLYSNISFNANVTQEEIIDTCIKTLQEAVNYENAGVRTNIYVISPVEDSTDYDYVINMKIPVKRSTERLNVLKLAFPMAHPSMLRRLAFAFRERCSELKDNQYFFTGYGAAMRDQKAIGFTENCK